MDFLHAGSAAYITSFQVDDMFSCFETDHRCDRQTDRQTGCQQGEVAVKTVVSAYNVLAQSLAFTS